MRSTRSKLAQAALTSLSLPASAIEQAIQLLKLYSLSADLQLTIEAAIAQVAQHPNCSRLQAAYWLNKQAFPVLD